MHIGEGLWFMKACSRASLDSSRRIVCRRSVRSRVTLANPTSWPDSSRTGVMITLAQSG